MVRHEDQTETEDGGNGRPNGAKAWAVRDWGIEQIKNRGVWDFPRSDAMAVGRRSWGGW